MPKGALPYFLVVGSLLVVALVALFVSLMSMGNVANVGGALPDLTLERFDGGSLNLHDLTGERVVLHLWNSYCRDCVSEMRLYLDAAAAANPEYSNVQYLFVNQGNSREEVRAFLVQNSLPSERVLLDPEGQLMELYAVAWQPGTLMFRRDGNLSRTGGQVGLMQNLISDLRRLD